MGWKKVIAVGWKKVIAVGWEKVAMRKSSDWKKVAMKKRKVKNKPYIAKYSLIISLKYKYFLNLVSVIVYD